MMPRIEASFVRGDNSYMMINSVVTSLPVTLLLTWINFNPNMDK